MNSECTICTNVPTIKNMAFICLRQHVVCVPCLIKGSQNDMKACPICRSTIFLSRPGPFVQRALRNYHQTRNGEKNGEENGGENVEESVEISDKTRIFHRLVDNRIFEFTYRSIKYFANCEDSILQSYAKFVDVQEKLKMLEKEQQALCKKILDKQSELVKLQTAIYRSFRYSSEEHTV